MSHFLSCGFDVSPFNSLFEMHIMSYMHHLASPLSFNSLFEMQHIEARRRRVEAQLETFNSLFEMRHRME